MAKTKKLSLLEVISMAVGTMIGASIFTIFGLGVKVAGHNLPEAFVLSGIYALVVAYSYSILGSKIVSNAGPIGFILHGLGDSLITGALSFLLWISYVVSISLLSKGFAGYFIPLLKLDPVSANYIIIESLVVLFFLSLHFFGSKAVGRSELFIVFIKVAILLLFITGGFITINFSGLKPELNADKSMNMINASIIFFLSYMGFGLITNASENLKNPQKNVPVAIYTSIFIVLFIYVSIAMVTLGNLPLDKIIEAKENALAAAAKPFLGNFGYFLISFGALFSISSALNASIFGGANIAYSLAKDGELPTFFERKIWFGSSEGLYITAGLGLLFAIIFDLGDIATITSSIFTLIYIFVVFSHIRIRKKYGGNIIVLSFNLLILISVFVALLLYQWNSHRYAFYGLIITLLGALIVEYLFRFVRKRIFIEHLKEKKT